MTTRELTLAALVALASAGGVYTLDKFGANELVILVADTTGKIELSKADADAILLDDAGQPRDFPDGTTVMCTPGGNLDGVWRDDIEWCSGGKGVTWTRPADGDETIEIIGGKAYSTRAR